MATQLGNLANSLGKKYDIYCSDRTVSQLKRYSYILPNNSIIISSPVNNNGNDKNTPSILMTDYKGEPLPLTYSFNAAQFNINEATNSVSINIDYIQAYMYSYFSNIFVRK